jgi:quercetin dioxygenase-like cupin family protein
MTRKAALAAAIVLSVAGSGMSSDTLQGTLYRASNSTTLRLILDEHNLGPEASLGEITFPSNSDSGDHIHGATEIFYVLSGELEHVVNGQSQILKPGMAGFVKPPDTVRHKTGPAGAKAVVVWVPAAEAGRIVARWTREP